MLTIEIISLCVSSALLLVLGGALFFARKNYLLEQQQKSITRINNITKFLHKYEFRGIEKSGSGIFPLGRSWKSYFRRKKWLITATLYTDNAVSIPTILYSKTPNIVETAMGAINSVYAMGDKEGDIKNIVKNKLDSNNNKLDSEEKFQSIKVPLSCNINVRLDIRKKTMLF